MIRSDFKNILEFNREHSVNAIYNTPTTYKLNDKEVKNTKKDTIELSNFSSFDIDRTQKLEKLKESIKNGEYPVDSKIIANAIAENLKTLK